MRIQLSLIRKLLLPIFAILCTIAFYSCSAKKEENTAMYKAFAEGFTNSSIIINKTCMSVLKELSEKKENPLTSQRGMKWYANAQRSQQVCDTMFNYIENLKSVLNRSTEEKADQFFNKESKDINLFERLKKCKNDLLAVDPEIKNTFQDIIETTILSSNSLKEERNFTETFFTNTSKAMAKVVLNQFQNNIRIIENKILWFCNNKVGLIIENFETYSAIVAQNISIARPGEQIEINAGLGTFIIKAKPEITINDISVLLNEEGYATYKFKAASKTGKHYVPVKIKYIDQDGKENIIKKQVEYTIVKVCDQ